MAIDTNPQNRAIIYCRVSSKEQEETGYSLDAQEKLLKEYAEKNNYSFKDRDVFRISESASGKQIRKKFDEMLRYIDKNKINLILCEKIDRLTRNLKDAAVVDGWIHDGSNREVHFVKESFILNQNTRAHENLVWDMKVAIARFYTNNLSEEVRKGQKEKIAQGQLPTKPPLGYCTVGEKGHKVHVIDENFAPFIKEMFELYATGNYSTGILTDHLNNKGFRTRLGKKMSRSKTHVLLTDPFYYGEFRWKGRVYPGEHEPLISKDLWDKVQELLKERNSGKKPARGQLFQGKIICDHCGGRVTWYEQKGRVYGHCTYHGKSKGCKGKTCLKEDKVEEQVIEIIESLAPANEDILAWIEDVIKSEYGDRANHREKEINAINHQLKEVREKKDKTIEAKVLEKAPIEYCDRKIDEYYQQEKALENELSKITDDNHEYQKLAIIIHELAYRGADIYKVAKPEDKKILFRELFVDLIQDKESIKPKFTEAAEYLHTWMPVLNSYYAQNKQMPKSSDDVEMGKLVNSKLRTEKRGSIKQQTAQNLDGLRPKLRG